ncbi:MAG TPA: phospholipase D-like domain-containing protein [Gemmatimonadaceae bacterium]|nr:phospholipase D-like domain-containing protein [Gemmatimonadaceae bacterium]
MQIVLWTLGAAGLLFLLALALIGLRYLTRGTPVADVSGVDGNRDLPATADDEFRASIELLTGTKLTCGNYAELCLNGDGTYERLFADLASATQTITLQMYYCQPGKVADRFADAMRDRAKAGVRVLFLLDAFGSAKLTKEYFRSLTDAGVEVAKFRPVNWYQLEKAYARSHIRVVVVDGRVGYTGGFGMDDKWLGDGRHKDQWRDTNVRFTGPAVLQLQATFAKGWAEATGELLTGTEMFPPASEDGAGGEMHATLLHTAPTIGSTAAERLLALSIAAARHTLYITNSYFVPDDDFVRLLREAAARGVDVRVLTPGTLNDVKSTWYAGRAQYERLLDGGVRIFWYQPAMIHGKSFVVDGCWASIGTMNFDNRSLAFNDESNLLVLDENFGSSVRAMFLDDLTRSKEVTLEQFRRRPRKDRILEWGASRVARIL